MSQSKQILKVASLPRSGPKLRPIPPERSSSPRDRVPVSVVIPAYNEEASVVESVLELRSILEEAGHDADDAFDGHD